MGFDDWCGGEAVSEPTYTITITEAERTALARVLGLLVTKLTSAPVSVEAPSGGTQAARAVLSPPAQTPPQSSPAAAAPTAPVIEQRDRWARDRKGNELAFPEGTVTREVHLSKTEQKQPRKAGGKEFLKVTWQSDSRGFVDANCFDNKLWPWLINQTGKRTTLYLMKSGEYLNVVGVRA
jgi:hypothetical protein